MSKRTTIPADQNMSSLEAAFISIWRMEATDMPSPQREYVFHSERKWRFDFAWPEYQVAVEINGGTYSRGRHSRAAGQREDCDKINAAIATGWQVFTFTNIHIKQQVPELVQLPKAAIRNSLRRGNDD